MAGLTALLLREYYQSIGIRVADLGLDSATRVADVLVSVLFLIGLLGPLLFAGVWRVAVVNWVATSPSASNVIERGRGLRIGAFSLGKLIFSG